MFDRLNSAITGAILSGDLLPAWAVHQYFDNSGYGQKLEFACAANTALPSDNQIVEYKSQSWTKSLDPIAPPVLQEYVAAYDKPIGAEAVVEAERALSSCSHYNWQGAEYIIDGRVTVGYQPPGSHQFAFCERIQVRNGSHESYVCTLTYGNGHLACSVRVLYASRSTTEALLGEVVPAIQKACSG